MKCVGPLAWAQFKRVLISWVLKSTQVGGWVGRWAGEWARSTSEERVAPPYYTCPRAARVNCCTRREEICSRVIPGSSSPKIREGMITRQCTIVRNSGLAMKFKVYEYKLDQVRWRYDLLDALMIH